MKFTSTETTAVFLRLLSYLTPYKINLLLALLASLLYALFNLAVVRLARPLMDDVLIAKNPDMLLKIPFLIVFVFLAKNLSQFFEKYQMQFIGQSIIRDLRNQLFQHVTALSLQFFQRNPSGVLISRITNDVGQLEMGIAKVLGDVIRYSLSLIGLMIYLFLLSWKLSLLAIVVLPLTLYPLHYFATRLRKASTQSQEQMADINNTMFETFYGINIVKAFNMERKTSDKFAGFNQQYFRSTMKARIIDALSPSLMETIGSIAAAVVFFVGGYVVYRGEMTSGMFMEFLTGVFLLYDPIKNLSKTNFYLQRAVAAGVRIIEVLDTKSDIVELPDAIPLQQEILTLSFENVSFQYDEERVLHNISFSVQKGKVLAIVGASGSGKSTIVNLIPRFFDTDNGVIKINGKILNSYTLHSLRNRIGIVTQETVLFNDTISHNISFGQPAASAQDIRDAAMAAYAHEFIRKLPNGYNTIIGERGVTLSGGERQRIAIARAILKNPPILILDEATSALDTESELIIQKALSNLMKNRTTFVIAHRLSTIRNADQIIVLDHGKIVEQGHHETLLAKQGEYNKLYEMQFQPEHDI